MKKFRLIFLGMLFCSFIVFSTLNFTNPSIESLTSNNYDSFLNTSYTIPFITIDDSATGVGAHNWTWARSQPWCTQGSGIKSDPYIINNVTTSFSVSNSWAYFVLNNSQADVTLTNVKNCLIRNVSKDMAYADNAVVLTNVSNSEFTLNSFSTTGYQQIIIDGCEDLTFNENSFYLTGFTFNYELADLDNCKNITFVDNEFERGAQAGITLQNVNESKFYNNILREGQGNGFELKASYNNTFKENVISNNNNVGFLIQDVDDTSAFTQTSNTIIDNEIYNHNLEGMKINNCLNLTIYSNEIRENSVGILAEDSQSLNITENEVLKNEFNGTTFINCLNLSIIGNKINNNEKYGISLINTDGCLIINNELIDNEQGIIIQNSFFNQISNNNIQDRTNDQEPPLNLLLIFIISLKTFNTDI